jgi:hypothetical protein
MIVIDDASDNAAITAWAFGQHMCVLVIPASDSALGCFGLQLSQFDSIIDLSVSIQSDYWRCAFWLVSPLALSR